MTSKRIGSFGRFGRQQVRIVAAAGVLVAAGAAGTAISAVNAQSPSPSPSAAPNVSPRPAGSPSLAAQQRQSDHINRLAQNLGVTADKLKTALQQTALQEVDAAVTAGNLTAQQAQQVKDRINSGDFGPGGFGGGFGGFSGGVGGFGGGFGGDRHGPGGPGGPGGFGFGFGATQDQLAQFLSITAQQLQTEENGKSLTQLAQAHGKTRAQLVQFLTSAAQQRLAADVQAGRLTQAQADQRLTDLTSRIEQMVDQVRQMGQRPGGVAPSGSPVPRN